MIHTEAEMMDASCGYGLTWDVNTSLCKTWYFLQIKVILFFKGVLIYFVLCAMMINPYVTNAEV